MPKASIKMNDDFIFLFSKRTVGNESETRVIPNYVLDHFLKNYKRFQILDESIQKKYSEYSNYVIDLNSEPFFLLEFELTYSGSALGGILQRLNVTEESEVSVNYIETIFEDDEFFYLKFNISGQVYWDFKPTHLKKFQTYVENHKGTWDNANIYLRLNFRDNFLYTDSLKYNHGSSIPEEPESADNIRFILEISPNIFSTIKNYKPQNKWELESKFWQMFDEKDITLVGKYLEHFN